MQKGKREEKNKIKNKIKKTGKRENFTLFVGERYHSGIRERGKNIILGKYTPLLISGRRRRVRLRMAGGCDAG